ncbi:MAG: hypothetical protein M0P57_05075 [Syntrophales bacterium]|jgi:hypothetical protein|nr:hypothetical protein [Syntrophales bacterium]
MKVSVFILSVIILSLSVLSSADAQWRILLKNGGEFIAVSCWKEKGELKIYMHDIVVGVKSHSVRKIEKIFVDEISVEENKKAPPEDNALPASVEEEKQNEEAEPQGRVDMNAYREKKERLESELEMTLTRVHEAAKIGDMVAKERAQEEMRETSARIYELTEELKQANNNTLPSDWWGKK